MELMLAVDPAEAGVAIAALAFAGTVVTASFAFVLKMMTKLDKLADLVNRLIVVEETRMKVRHD